jgi:hypothetical protein
MPAPKLWEKLNDIAGRVVVVVFGRFLSSEESSDGVEVRGFEPLTSSVRGTIRVIGGPGRMLGDAC